MLFLKEIRGNFETLRKGHAVGQIFPICYDMTRIFYQHIFANYGHAFACAYPSGWSINYITCTTVLRRIYARGNLCSHHIPKMFIFYQFFSLQGQQDFSLDFLSMHVKSHQIYRWQIHA